MVVNESVFAVFLDGEKQIIQNPGEKQRQDIEKCEFDQHEVFAIDVLISTGEGSLLINFFKLK